MEWSFSRDLLSLIGKGGDAPPPEQRQDEMEEGEEEVDLALSLGFGIGTKGDKLPRSSSAAALTTPAEVPVPVPPALPRTSSVPVQVAEHAPRLPASESPSSASLEGDGQRLQDSVPTTPVKVPPPPALPPASRSPSSASLEGDGQRRLQVTCCAEAVVGTAKRRRGRPPKHQVSIASPNSLSTPPNSAFKGTALTEVHSSSSSVPSSSKAIRRATAANPPPSSSSLSPRTAATLGSSPRGDQSKLGRGAARANSTGDDVGRRLMQEMPTVYTKELPNGNKIKGILYKYRKADDVKIVCICHGSFLTPSEFVEHAGAGKVDNPLRHIHVVSPSLTP